MQDGIPSYVNYRDHMVGLDKLQGTNYCYAVILLIFLKLIVKQSFDYPQYTDAWKAAIISLTVYSHFRSYSFKFVHNINICSSCSVPNQYT